MDPTTLLAFAAAFLVFAASPGPDNMTIVARTLSHGPAAGIAYGLGMVAGILALLVLAATGLAVVAREMGTAMTVLRYAGAAYLVWTGIRLWTAEPVLPTERTDGRRPRPRASVLTGLALNLGNPKMPLFYSRPAAECRRHRAHAAPGRAPGGGDRRGRGAGDRRPRPPRRPAAAPAPHPRRVRRANRAAGGVMVGAGVAVVAVR